MNSSESHSQLLLLAILAEIEAFAELPDDVLDVPDRYLAAMVQNGVPFAPALWIGRPLPASRRMAFSRATRRLAASGLIRRLTEPHRDRVRQVVPTASGLRRALSLAGDKADRTAVREGLARSHWGRTLANQI